MSWDVRDPEKSDRLVLLTIAGAVDGAELRAAMQAAITSCIAHDAWLVLTDLTGMNAGHTVVDLFGLITVIGDLGVRGRFREAVVAGSDPRTLELAQFFETAGVNRGLSIRAFTDVESARAWLTS